MRAGILEPHDLPLDVGTVVGTRRSEQIGTFVLAVLDAIDRTGSVGMAEPAASALASFRAFTIERIYLRPAPCRQAERVVALLRGHVDHYADARSASRSCATGRAAVARARVGPRAAAIAVRYVSGMTDRYALGLGVDRLRLAPRRPPRGV